MQAGPIAAPTPTSSHGLNRTRASSVMPSPCSGEPNTLHPSSASLRYCHDRNVRVATTVAMSRFFVQLVKRVSEKEDVFTECLAAALREDPHLARRFALKLCGDQRDDVDVRGATIDVATQSTFPARTGVPGCCIDMVFTPGGTTKIGVENKLFAGEGRDQQGTRDQLRNYLRLGLSGGATRTLPALRLRAPEA